MRRRTIELRSGTWEWSVVDPDDPRRQSGLPIRARATTPAAPTEGARTGTSQEPDLGGAPPLPRRRIELRSIQNDHHRMCVRVPPHLGNAGDDAAVTMLALNPDRRIVVDPEGITWSLWPEQHQEASAATHTMSGPRLVRAKKDSDRARIIPLPDGLALGQLTDREILDLLG